MLGGRSCGRRRDRLQVLASEAPGIQTLTGGHTPHLKDQLGGLCGAGFQGARRSLWPPAPEGARVGCGRNIGVYRGVLESSSPSWLLLQGLARVRKTLARAVLALDTCA